MRGHAETVWNGLEILFLFVNAVLAAPPPRLVNERAVRGIHQADDAVVDADRHLRLQIGQLVFRREFFNLWRGIGSIRGRSESCAGRTGIMDVNPDETVLLFAGI